MYELADELLAGAGYEWYEVSNWARGSASPVDNLLDGAEHRSRHNLAYWQGHDWWGIGPGAHSHIGGVRWWNVKHPAAYADRIAAGQSPAAGRETLDVETQRVERVLLTTRIRDGLSMIELTPSGRTAVAGLIADELVDAGAALHGTIRLTLRGRLLADAVVRRLLDD
jgi:oxygen-independent coproporphyrinogen-3 oxidase